MAMGAPIQAKVKEVTFPKASNWLVNMGDKSCLLARKFGTDDKPILLSMRAYAPGYKFEINVAGAPAKGLQNAPTFTIAYGEGQPLPVWSHQNGQTDIYGATVIFSNTMSMKALPVMGDEADALPQAFDPAFEAQIDRISLATTSQRLILQTGPMAKALATLRQCTDGQKMGTRSSSAG